MSAYFNGAYAPNSVPSFSTDFNTSIDNVLVGSNAQNLGLAGTSITVPLGGDIQAAIDKVADSGGGTVYLLAGAYVSSDRNIYIKERVSLVGAGRTETSIVFGSQAYGIKAIGTSSNSLGSFRLANFAIGRSDATAGIDIDYGVYFEIENVVVGTSNVGIRIQHSVFFTVQRCFVAQCDSHGFAIVSDSTAPTYIFQFLNSVSEDNGGDGFNFEQSNSSGVVCAFFGCAALNNTGDGFNFNGGGGVVGVSVGCQSSGNGGDGFDIATDRCGFVTNVTSTNGGYGFTVSGDSNVFIGNTSDDDTGTYLSSGTGNRQNSNTWQSDPTGVTVTVKCISEGTSLSTGDGLAYFTVPLSLNGYNLTNVAAHVYTASSSGTPTIQIRNVTQGADMLSTRITIDVNEKDSSSAAAAAVIDTSNDDVATADEIAIDVDTAGTSTAGLDIRLTFSLP